MHSLIHDFFEKADRKEFLRIVTGASVYICGLILKGMGVREIFTVIVFLVSYLILGYEVLIEAIKKIIHAEFLDESFLMTAATVGALILSKYSEAVFVMLFYSTGEFLQDFAVEKSKADIGKLLNLKPKRARLIGKDGSCEIIDPSEVMTGSEICVLSGEVVPIDGVLVSPISVFETKSITGESLPRTLEKGDTVLSGFVCLDGKAEIKTSSSFSDSTVCKILESIQNDREKKAPVENFITSFARIYTPLVVLSALLIAVIPSLITSDWSVWVHRALSFLVISCPCALILSVPLTFFSGMGKCAAKGIIVKGAVNLQNLSGTEAFVFDKTGTLTTGVFDVTKVDYSGKVSVSDILGITYALESCSNHPVAKCLSLYCSKRDFKRIALNNIKEIPGYGMEGDDGTDRYQVRKSSESEGISVLKNGEEIAHFTINDVIKPEAGRAISELRESGIRKIIMLTGDNRQTAADVADALNISSFSSGMLPYEKTDYVRKLSETCKCAFVGDGINDSSVLLTADTGISMGRLGSESAIEASGIVITDDRLDSIPTVLKIARKTIRLVRQNIALALGIKVLVLILSSLGICGMGAAVFADTGVTMLCVLNSLR